MVLNIIKEDINRLLKEKKQVIIAIDGMSTSGKTTLANDLLNIDNTYVIHMDDFYLQDFQRTEERLNEVGGNLDYERFKEEVINSILNQQDIFYHTYDCQRKLMTFNRIPNDYRLLVIEGAYALREEFRVAYDLTYLLLIDQDKQRMRIKDRNPRLYDQFVNEWIPKENKYIQVNQLSHIVNRVFNI